PRPSSSSTPRASSASCGSPPPGCGARPADADRPLRWTAAGLRPTVRADATVRREEPMGATSPEQWWAIWSESFDRGDVETILRLYDPGATVVPNPGNPITGVADLRETLQGFVDMHGTLKGEQGPVLHGPGVATSYIPWTFDADLSGEPFHLEGVATVMLADRPDGWVALIDDFYGRGGPTGAVTGGGRPSGRARRRTPNRGGIPRSAPAGGLRSPHVGYPSSCGPGRRRPRRPARGAARRKAGGGGRARRPRPRRPVAAHRHRRGGARPAGARGQDRQRPRRPAPERPQPGRRRLRRARRRPPDPLRRRLPLPGLDAGRAGALGPLHRHRHRQPAPPAPVRLLGGQRRLPGRGPPGTAGRRRLPRRPRPLRAGAVPPRPLQPVQPHPGPVPARPPR